MDVMSVVELFLLLFGFFFSFLEGAHSLPAATQGNGSQSEEPEINVLCCSTCKRPYEPSTSEEHIAKRVKHDELYSLPTVSEDKFSYMGEVFHYSYNSFQFFTLFHK